MIDGVNQYKIADLFNVAQGTISMIKLNKRYAEIQNDNIDLNILPKGRRKLNTNQILQIRKLLMQNISQPKIAVQFGVSRLVIGAIKTNERYADIQLPEKENNE